MYTTKRLNEIVLTPMAHDTMWGGGDETTDQPTHYSVEIRSHDRSGFLPIDVIFELDNLTESQAVVVFDALAKTYPKYQTNDLR
jgi:hypothetical protein